MWRAEGAEVRREVDASRLRPLPIERTYDVVSLTQQYLGLELCQAEARNVVEGETLTSALHQLEQLQQMIRVEAGR